MTRGFFALALFHPKKAKNLGVILRTAHAYGAQFVAIIGERYQRVASDTTHAGRSVPIFHVPDWAGLSALVPSDTKLVGVEQHLLARPLPSFRHPEWCIYVLGAEDYGLPAELCGELDALVEVPTLMSWSINVAVAGSVVLYDRHAKALAHGRVAA